MILTNKPSLAVFAALAALMALTRVHHFGPLPDASWALFFAGGFYLCAQARWALPLLLVEAVLLDWLSTRYLGVSADCFTPAYWAIAPGYAVLWLGGAWLRRTARGELRDLLRLAGSAFVAITVCYAITNSAFYWLSGVVATPDAGEYLAQLARYYGPFLQVPAAYLAVAAALHAAVGQALPALMARGRHPVD